MPASTSVTASNINAGKEEQPNHVDEVPIPSCGLKSEVLLGLEMSRIGPEEAHRQEDSAHQHMEAVKASRHIKR